MSTRQAVTIHRTKTSDWFKSLGRKLLATGAAYLEQVKLVEELKKLPPDQGRERFMASVQGLSAGARAGLTLATLASNERQADAKRFLEMLRAALANPTAGRNQAQSSQTTTLPASQPQSPDAPSVSAPAVGNSLDDDLKPRDLWMALDDDERPAAIEEHVASLSHC